MTPREIDEDERREAIDQRRAWRRVTVCQCPGEMPGRCPGPASCPLAQPAEEEELICEICGEQAATVKLDECAACEECAAKETAND